MAGASLLPAAVIVTTAAVTIVVATNATIAVIASTFEVPAVIVTTSAITIVVAADGIIAVIVSTLEVPAVVVATSAVTIVVATNATAIIASTFEVPAVAVTIAAVTIVVAAADDAIVIIVSTFEVPAIAIAIAAAAQITVKVRLPVDIRPAVGRAIEIRHAIPTIVKVPASFTAIRVTIEVRSAAPAIAVAIEVTVAVVTIPIVAEAEDNDGNTERAIILRPDINAALLIKCLDISAVHPATAAVELHVAPWHVGKAAVDFDGFAGRNYGDRRIFCAWTRPHIDVRRREAFCRLSDRRSKQEHTGRGNF
ncbi:putative membrane protein [Rhizobium mongolense]